MFVNDKGDSQGTVIRGDINSEHNIIIAFFVQNENIVAIFHKIFEIHILPHA